MYDLIGTRCFRFACLWPFLIWLSFLTFLLFDCESRHWSSFQCEKRGAFLPVIPKRETGRLMSGGELRDSTNLELLGELF